MQQTSSKVPQLKSENKYPDCLCMELEGVKVQQKGLLNKITQIRSKANATEQVDLYLHIQFNEQKKLLPGGKLIDI